MSRLFFTADQHFGHRNIIDHTNRPFTGLDEMNEAMIERWNAVVGVNDIVYHLGDVGFYSQDRLRAILDRLRGHIFLIRGNHDRKLRNKVLTRFQEAVDYKEVKIPDPDAPRGSRLIILSHYAKRTWNCRHWGSWHLYGHSHDVLPPWGLSFDVGVDGTDPFGTPWSFDQVKAKMATLHKDAENNPAVPEFTRGTRKMVVRMFRDWLKKVADNPSDYIESDYRTGIAELEQTALELGVDMWAYLKAHRSAYEVRRLELLKATGVYPSHEDCRVS